MAYQSIFKRYELKYLLTRSQKELILQAMAPYMTADKYGRSTIRNIYYDTDSYRLIRRSIEKPKYKEKLRVRSYTLADSDSTVFVELKKKFDSIVYKRRIPMRERDAVSWLSGNAQCPADTQISREICYFLRYYESLTPKVFLSYEREAYYSSTDPSFRVTFDENILSRTDALSLSEAPSGTSLLEEGYVLMEVKCAGGIPLWLVKVLSREKIYKTSFSKYGEAYRRLIFPRMITKYQKENVKKCHDQFSKEYSTQS